MAAEGSALDVPNITLPRDYNAAADLIDRNLKAGRGDKIAVVDDAGHYTYRELAERVDRAANAFRALGIEPEHRVLLCLLDSIDFPTVFLGAIKAGIVPVPVNTVMTPADYDFMLRDSRSRALIVSDVLLDRFKPILANQPALRHVVVSGGQTSEQNLATLLATAKPKAETAATTRDDVCFWLYTSGSTGTPKGAVHLQSHPILTAELYAKGVLRVTENDTVYSAAKLFFAYGLGNALTFPMSVGATSVLFADRPTPVAVAKILVEKRPSIFCGVPTLYAAMLAAPELPLRDKVALRVCISAGEALPEQIGRRWLDHFGVDILDGIGSTEMLHIFLSNRPGSVRYGTTGVPVPGYSIRLVDEQGQPTRVGDVGELQVSGPTSAPQYWNNRERSRDTFQGLWTRSGDKYTCNADGYYTYCGRTDDMLKVGGIYVSPFEVETALVTHDAVLEVAVVAHADENRLIKPKAFVVLRQGNAPSPELAQALQQHVKANLAPYKYPRWIEFVSDLPKTATGKIQRFKLRELERRH
jgi:benzoate-CoA ligase